MSSCSAAAVPTRSRKTRYGRAQPDSLTRKLIKHSVVVILLLLMLLAFELLQSKHEDAEPQTPTPLQAQPQPHRNGKLQLVGSVVERNLQGHSKAKDVSTSSAAADTAGSPSKAPPAASGQSKTTAAAGQSAPTATCLNGFYQGSRHEFWQYVDGESPALMDLVQSQDRVYAVFNLKLPKPWGYLPWSNGTWRMSFHVPLMQGEPVTRGRENSSNQASLLTVPAYSLATDSSGYTLVVFAYLPKHLQSHPDQGRHHLVDVSVDMQGTGSKAQQADVSQVTYKAVPFCWSPATQSAGVSLPSNAANPPALTEAASGMNQAAQSGPFHHLVSCTEILSSVVHLVPEWVAYHHLQGFEHFYIYVNDHPQLVSQQLQPLIKAGLVTVVDFRWPPEARKAYVNPKCPKCRTSWSQVAQMNSCIMRARGAARWVALHDVDEFFQVLPPAAASHNHTRPAVPQSQHGSQQEGLPERPPGAATVAEFLTLRSAQENLAAFQVGMIYFGAHSDDSRQAALNSSSQGGLPVLQRYVSRAQHVRRHDRFKMFVNPTAVSYVVVHAVSVGGQVQLLNGTTEMRLCHYKQPHTGMKFSVPDQSMSALAGQVQQHLQSFYSS